MNRKKDLFEKEKPGIGMIIQFTIIGMFLVLVASFLIASIQKGRTASAGQNETVEETKSLTETRQQEETKASETERIIMIDGIILTGLSREEAKNKLMDAYQWDIRLSYQNQVEVLSNPLPSYIDGLLEEIYSQDKVLWTENYVFETASMENGIREQVKAFASKWDRKPVSGQLTGRDKENGSWIYSGGENGIQVDQETAVQQIMGLMKEKEFAATVMVHADEIAPELSKAEVKQKYQVIGAFSTTATSNSNRNNNISLAMNALDGLVIYPGEEFSFNETTGNRTTERGYLPAGAYRNGEFVEEPGGGVCQVSSTLYNAIIFSGIMTTERHPHSFEPSYVIPGEDAMVSYDGYSGPDLRFVNTQDTSVAIRAVFEDNKLTVSIIGMPVLEEGMEVSMRSQKTKEYDPPEPKYEEDQTLLPGQEIVVQEGVGGTTWKTWLVTVKDGKVIEEDYFHTSTYRGKPGIVKRNTSGVVIPGAEEPDSDKVSGEGGINAAEPNPSEPDATTPKNSTTTPTGTTPTEPTPTEPTPTEPTPTEPTPTASNPTESNPTKSNPTEPNPTVPNPTEPIPKEEAPDEGAAFNESLMGHTATEPSTTDSGLMENASGNTDKPLMSASDGQTEPGAE